MTPALQPFSVQLRHQPRSEKQLHDHHHVHSGIQELDADGKPEHPQWRNRNIRHAGDWDDGGGEVGLFWLFA